MILYFTRCNVKPKGNLCSRTISFKDPCRRTGLARTGTKSTSSYMLRYNLVILANIMHNSVGAYRPSYRIIIAVRTTYRLPWTTSYLKFLDLW